MAEKILGRLVEKNKVTLGQLEDVLDGLLQEERFSHYKKEHRMRLGADGKTGTVWIYDDTPLKKLLYWILPGENRNKVVYLNASSMESSSCYDNSNYRSPFTQELVEQLQKNYG